MKAKKDSGIGKQNLRVPVSSGQSVRTVVYGQSMSQAETPDVTIEQVLLVLLWLAIPCQLGGGPGSAVAVTVTPTVG
ncbi:MAG TPA: hypothetical protein VK516_00310, partial [Gemmatimonadaceae bacterium]|nr:hypothetical protein [Gemmatimonadaceae bacterium]